MTVPAGGRGAAGGPALDGGTAGRELATTTLTGGQALVRALRTQGVDTVFGLPGVQMDWAFDALYEQREAIRVIHTRHEQALSYMADGYARITGRAGVCLMVPGPGLLNALAGLATAYACSSPVLCVTGQIPSAQIGKGRGLLHEIKHQLRAADCVTKWTGSARRPDAVPGLVREAFRQMLTGHQRPAAIEVPPDVLRERAEMPECHERVERTVPAPDPDAIERAAALLGAAERPLIFVGGGIVASGASEALRAVAEMLEAPVLISSNGKGALSDRHYLAEPLLAGAELSGSADAVLIVGTRFYQPASSDWGPRGQPCVQIDIDPDEIGRNRPATVGIVADAAPALAALAEGLAAHNRVRPSRKDELAALKQRMRARMDSVLPQAAYGAAIRDALPEDGVVVSEMTQVGYWSNIGFPVYHPRTYLTMGYQGTLGAGYAIALGAYAGAAGRPVVALCGDGGFLYNVQELSTAVRHRLNVVAVVFRDGAYGNVRRIQQDRFGGRFIASDLLNPDFVRLAESFGAAGRRADGPEQLREALRWALRQDAPALIDVPVDPMPDMWPVLRPGYRG
ncbi:MAG TPA: thiamine pyrophosphate-dependent enzyme [bacterium]|nr:thiamine pyrophosphate-dependent enzyme [bacterium]